MSDIFFRVVEAFPEPETSALEREVFADYEQSQRLAEVLASEAAARPKVRGRRIGRCFALQPSEEKFWSAGRRDIAKGRTSSTC